MSSSATSSHATEASRSKRLLHIVIGSALAWGAFYILRTSFVIDGERVFTLWDDGMISMRYAKNFALGHGLVWNPGELAVQGYSNPLVTLAMAAVHGLGFADAKAALVMQLLNLAFVGVTLWLSAQIAEKMFRDGTARLGASTALAVACCAPVAVWSLQGSDVGFVAVYALTCLYLLCGPGERCHRWLPWFVAVGVWIRMDTVLVTGIALLAVLGLPGDRSRARRTFLRGSLVTAASALALLAFGQLYYGNPLPNTFYLKATGSPQLEVLAWGFEDIEKRIVGWLPLLVLAGVALAREGKRNVPALATAAMFTIAVAYNVWVGSDWMKGYESRFYAPLLPCLLLLSTQGLHSLARDRVPAFALLGSVCMLGVFANAPNSNRDWFQFTQPTMYHAKNKEMVEQGLYLKTHSEPTTRIGSFWGGIPPYFSDRPAVDVLGKSDPHIARVPAESFWPGHSKYDWPYVIDERKPDVFLRASPDLKKRDDFKRAYVLARNASFEVYVRKGSLEKLTAASWQIRDLETGAVRRWRRPR